MYQFLITTALERRYGSFINSVSRHWLCLPVLPSLPSMPLLPKHTGLSYALGPVPGTRLRVKR